MREHKVNDSEGAGVGGPGHEVLKKNRNFYIGVAGTVLEGLLSGSLFLLLYAVMQFLWAGRFDMNRTLVLTGLIAGIFLLRILIYSYGYTKAQIGGAEVSKNIRLFMGDHLKRIPLSRFTQGQTGGYINTITSDVNNYEKILTHKIGDLAKSFALSLMLIVFVMTVYVPAGLILLAADLLLIPGLWISFCMVRKYGREKNDICAENVSSIVEYVSGIQTFRAYGVGGLKNKTVIDAMREFCRISYVYEAKVLPVGAGLGILIWLACPLVIWTAYTPWAAGALDTVSYLLICMLPLFCAKLANTIFVDLTSYKNLMISKDKILGVMEEPEESGSMEPFQTDTHDITFDHVDFAYVPGEPVLKQATFTVPDQKLTAIVGDSGSGKSTILNLIAGFEMPSSGHVLCMGKDITGPGPDRGMVFQNTALFPWLTVMGNVEYGPKVRGIKKEERRQRAQHYIDLVGLQGFENSFPVKLSGGMQQRVGIARAYCNEPLVMLLDEPFGHLDAQTRYLMQDELTRIWQAEKRTVIFVTNNIEEAVYLADRILVLRNCPTGVKAEYEINLPRPRNYTDPEFLRLRREIDSVVDHTL